MPAGVAFGEAHGEEVVLRDAAGNPWDEKRGRPRMVLLSRLDCEVLCLEIPPVAEHELAGLIRYRVRSVYPGSVENAAIDHVIQRRRRGGGRVALVAVTETQTLEKYRRAAPKAALSVLAAALLSSSASRRDGPVVNWAARCVEVMRFRDGTLVESTLVRRSRRETDAQKIARLLEAAAPQQPPLVIAPQAELESLAVELSAPAFTGPGGPAPEPRPLDSIDFSRRRTASLFPRRRRFAGPRPALVRAALALLVVLLAAGFFLRYLRFKENELALLRTAVLGTQEADQAQARLGAQYDSLKARVQGLIRDRPVDAFQFLADLHTVLGPGVAVQDIVLQNGAFQFQALGPSPLSYMQRFLADSRFRDVRLLQTTPIPRSSRQRFVITGRYGQ